MQSEYFKIQELVPQDIYNIRRNSCWELLNKDAIQMIDYLKEDFPLGSITINNWLWGGDRNESGLRTANCSFYSPTSQHSLGCAFDMLFSEYTSDDVRVHVIENLNDRYSMVKGIETDISWVHLDVRNSNNIKFFKG